MKVERITAPVLAAGALGFGVLGLVSPGRLGKMMGTSPEMAREIGVRDTANGIALLVPGSAAGALVARALYDLSDAAFYGRRKPGVAIGALAFAGLAVFTLVKDVSRS